jgi:hypothetical protein
MLAQHPYPHLADSCFRTALLAEAGGVGLLRITDPLLLLVQDFQVFGYARTKMSDEEFKTMITNTLTCRIDARWGASHLCAL